MPRNKDSISSQDTKSRPAAQTVNNEHPLPKFQERSRSETLERVDQNLNLNREVSQAEFKKISNILETKYNNDWTTYFLEMCRQANRKIALLLLEIKDRNSLSILLNDTVMYDVICCSFKLLLPEVLNAALGYNSKDTIEKLKKDKEVILSLSDNVLNKHHNKIELEKLIYKSEFYTAFIEMLNAYAEINHNKPEHITNKSEIVSIIFRKFSESDIVDGMKENFLSTCCFNLYDVSCINLLLEIISKDKLTIEAWRSFFISTLKGWSIGNKKEKFNGEQKNKNAQAIFKLLAAEYKKAGMGPLSDLVNNPNGKSETLLNLACFNGHLDIVTELLKIDDINLYTENHGGNALWNTLSGFAVYVGEPNNQIRETEQQIRRKTTTDIFCSLIAKYREKANTTGIKLPQLVDGKTVNNRTLLILACFNGMSDIVTEILNIEGVNITRKVRKRDAFTSTIKGLYDYIDKNDIHSLGTEYRILTLIDILSALLNKLPPDIRSEYQNIIANELYTFNEHRDGTLNAYLEIFKNNKIIPNDFQIKGPIPTNISSVRKENSASNKRKRSDTTQSPIAYRISRSNACDNLNNNYPRGNPPQHQDDYPYSRNYLNEFNHAACNYLLSYPVTVSIPAGNPRTITPPHVGYTPYQLHAPNASLNEVNHIAHNALPSNLSRMQGYYYRPIHPPLSERYPDPAYYCLNKVNPAEGDYLPSKQVWNQDYNHKTIQPYTPNDYLNHSQTTHTQQLQLTNPNSQDNQLTTQDNHIIMENLRRNPGHPSNSTTSFIVKYNQDKSNDNGSRGY
ncbi:MAG: hypothetical protein IPP74_03930 [Alphaproteobacteria bacterium]|nr:hypothetical protein [Alphaproteobacteria bacterium]